MNTLTRTQLTTFLRRANCCFADLSYESTKVFGYGNFEKGFCEFEKVESLYHYINALRCSTTGTQASIELCFDLIDIFGQFNSFIFDIPGFVGLSAFGSWTYEELIEAMNAVLVAHDAPFVVTGDGITNCFTITATSGEEANNETTISLDIVQGFSAPNHASGRLLGGLTELSGCIEEDNQTELMGRIEALCGCCSCHSFSYELTKDTL